MKKTYLTPALLAVKLSTTGMMANSPFQFTDDGESGSGGVNNVNADGAALVKSHSVWDDGWDE